jgi:hypothetical protein
MRGHLHGASSPLDATLETVLPGLHERLDAQRKAQEKMFELYSQLDETMKESIHTSIQSSSDANIQRFASEVNLMFKRMQRSAESDDSSSYIPEITQQHTGTTITNADTRTMSSHLPTIPITYSSLYQLYSHWNGCGEYENLHPGGIAKLEEQKGSTWRKNWDNSANKQKTIKNQSNRHRHTERN